MNLVKKKKWQILAELRAKHFFKYIKKYNRDDRLLALVHSHQEATCIGGLVLGCYKIPYEDFLRVKGAEYQKHHW